MTKVEKMEILSELSAILDTYIAPPKSRENPRMSDMAMLTINECLQQIEGLSRHTLRELIEHGEIKAMRAGTSGNGKILVFKTSLLDYFGKSQCDTEL